MVNEAYLKVVTERKPSDDELKDLMFAWKVAKFVKSNAIVYVKNQMTIGVGAGQMSRVYSAKVAGIKAADENLEVKGSVMASDAFFRSEERRVGKECRTRGWRRYGKKNSKDTGGNEASAVSR